MERLGVIPRLFADLCRQIALTTMRRIGSKAHPLMVVNYFAWVIVLVTGMFLVIDQPSWVYSVKSWGFMAIVGVFGGLMVCLCLSSVYTSDCVPNTYTMCRNSSSQQASRATGLLLLQS